MDKLGRRLFVAGAALVILHGMVHAVSLVRSLQLANATEQQLSELMTNYRFNLLGSLRSMDELLRGFSTCFTLSSLALGGLDLTLARERAALLKKAAMVNLIWLAAMTAVSLRYFFIAPTSFFVVSLLLFATAWLKLRRAPATSGA